MHRAISITLAAGAAVAVAFGILHHGRVGAGRFGEAARHDAPVVSAAAGPSATAPTSGTSTPSGSSVAVSAPAPGTPVQNILLMGVDRRPDDPGRSDVTLVLSVYPDHLSVLSVPRDTMITLPGEGTEKVNTAVVFGGVPLAEKAVSTLTGEAIDGSITVDFQGFEDAVDAIGGISYDVPKALNYDDATQDLHIHLQAGQQHLDGAQALNYVRWRADGLGDLGRICRQHDFLQAALAQLSHPPLTRIPALLVAAGKHVQTDLGPAGLVKLAAHVVALRDHITFSTLTGEAKYVDGISYWIPEAKAAGGTDPCAG